MKKVLALALVCLMISPSFGQFAKGDIKVGGIFNINMDGSKTTDGTTVKDPKHVNFEFMPEAGFFITDNTSIGGFIDLDFSHTTTFQNDNGGDEIKLKDKTSRFAVGPEIHHYRFIGEKKWFAIYGTAGIGFATGGGKVETYDPFNDEIVSTDKNKTIGLSVWAAPGMIIRPEHWFFFDVRFDGFGIWYNYNSEKEQGSDVKHKSSDLQIGGNLNELFLTNTKVGVGFIF